MSSTASWTLLPDYTAPTPPAAPSAPVATDPVLESIEILAKDMLLLTFSHEMANDAVLALASNYSITAEDDGLECAVSSVKTNNEDTTDAVILVVTAFETGKLYSVEVSPNVKTSEGVAVSAFNRAQFYGRLTKSDSLIDSRPRMYDTSVNSVMRALLLAFGREDDRIGGSRKDSLLGSLEGTVF